MKRVVLTLSEEDRSRHLRRVISVINDDAFTRYQCLILAETLRDLLEAMRPDDRPTPPPNDGETDAG